MHSKHAASLQRYIRLSLTAVLSGISAHAALAQGTTAPTGADALQEVVITTARQRAES